MNIIILILFILQTFVCAYYIIMWILYVQFIELFVIILNLSLHVEYLHIL